MRVSRSRTINVSPVTRMNYWLNYAEGVWWQCYIGSDIWFQDDFWEASSLGFQSSFSRYIEEVLGSIPRWLIASWEMISGFCPACLGVLICSVVLGWRLAVIGARFLTGGVFECVWPCTSSICGGIMYAVQDQVLPDAPSLWCSTWAASSGACYTRCYYLTSVYLCASLMQNLAVSISMERSWWLRIRWCGTGGFYAQSQCCFLGLGVRSIFVSNWFPFLFFHSMSWYCEGWVFGLSGR